MRRVNLIKLLLSIMLSLFVIISYQIPVFENLSAGTHSIMMDESTMEPLDFSGNNHPLVMIRKTPSNHKSAAHLPLQFLFMILSIVTIFRVPMIQPPFKVFYAHIKRWLYLRPIKFTSMFVAA